MNVVTDTRSSPACSRRTFLKASALAGGGLFLELPRCR